MINKMDENFKKMDAKLIRIHGWPTISLIKGGIISCCLILKNTTCEMLGNTSNYNTYFLNMNLCSI
jgi:hypothetical protein